MKHIAIKRLLADLKEVLENPQADAVALPLEDSLFVWHANLRLPELAAADLAPRPGADVALQPGTIGEEAEHPAGLVAGCLEGVPIHLVLVFPITYPTEGPEIRMFHALPHPSVTLHPVPREASHGAAYRVALWDCNPSLDQWCPAYSLASILALLHSFLLDPALLHQTHVITHAHARRAALALQLEGHPHLGTAPCPAFPTQEDLSLAPRLRRMHVRRPPVNKELMLAVPDLTPPAAASRGLPRGEPEGWREVGHKGVRPRRHVLAEAAAEAAGNVSLAPSAADGGGFALLAVLEGEEEGEVEREVGEVEEDAIGAAVASAAVGCGDVAGDADVTTGAADVAAQSASAGAGRGDRRKRLLDDTILRCSQRSLVCDVLALYRQRLGRAGDERAARLAVHSNAIVGAADHRPAVEEGASAGTCFDLLSPDALAQVLLRMEARDVAALGGTCRSLRAACTDGEVWRALLARAFPASSLACADLADYPTAYQLEANGVVPELSCFYSRAPFDAEVLGFSYTYTVNPKTGLVDYCMPTSPDLVSVEAVQAGLVRRDAGGANVMGAVPAFITPDHFERAQPLLPAVLRQLCPRELKPGPEAWLTVLPTMLNTCVVMLCDHGTAASERSLNTYCGLHRLLLALCDRHALWDRAERRISRFLSQPAQRAKSETPNLGLVVPLLALSRRHDWRAVLPVVLEESLDRQVLWACKADRPLIERYRVAPERGGVDVRLVEGAFEASRVSLRLLMFHAAFLSMVGKPAGCSIGEVMYRLDSLYGRPGAGLRRRFQAMVKRILECRGWDEALDVMGLLPLSPAAWTAKLRGAWRNSLAKGYHDARTNWDRIQAGGVSRILLKGQQYSAPPNLAAIEVDERWRSRSREDFTFLDASCLLFGRPRGSPPGAPLERLDVVDFSHTRSRDRGGSVTHSGDMIDGDAGQHTLAINLRSLPPWVDCLFLTMSSWHGAKLNDVEHPYIWVKVYSWRGPRLDDVDGAPGRALGTPGSLPSLRPVACSVRDPASGVELCQFQLEDVPAATRAACSSVVMLKVLRGAAAGRWDIEAVGHVGQGDASDYAPIEGWILQSINPRPAASAAARRRR